MGQMEEEMDSLTDFLYNGSKQEAEKKEERPTDPDSLIDDIDASLAEADAILSEFNI